MMDSSLGQPFAELSEAVGERLWGKYRGIVESVEDEERLGRITVSIPSVFHDTISRPALPAVPFAGPNGAFLFLPQPGDGVWIEFERGDPSLPIWTGCWWARGEIPSEAAAQTRVLITPAGLKLIMDDGGQQIRLLNGTDGEITISQSGIMIRFGGSKIEVDNNGIRLNDLSLKVT